MGPIEVVLMIYAVAWIVSLPGIAACMLSSKISQQEEKRDAKIEMDKTGDTQDRR